MDRRTTIKSIIVVAYVGLSSFSFYKWIALNSAIDIQSLDQKKSLIAELGEVIIPRTDTPGAKDAKVEEYTIRMIKYCTERISQHNFLNGLNDLEVYVQKNYKRDFAACTEKEKIAVLQHFEDKSVFKVKVLNKINNKFFGIPFFVRLKQLTTEGYCISELGATKGLAYDYIPHMYQPCIPLTKDQKSWATK
ncbi:gluconate 2-dehydrogenase subunit 3 family protein [Pedobacter sp. L105]|uniref:gluconate 2-dehydrogenase subunit 3 family protein n=1 Tax=Pedobacter sp. L105 TaxID=1641871 RepID=UPI00131B5606|nr:gluconate 2-dehydrogenase subunit 3 family protein [Pedobacter sp. L105]